MEFNYKNITKIFVIITQSMVKTQNQGHKYEI